LDDVPEQFLEEAHTIALVVHVCLTNGERWERPSEEDERECRKDEKGENNNNDEL
jgi:hypothetical protein